MIVFRRNHFRFIILIHVFACTVSLAQYPFMDVTQSAGIQHQFEVFEGTFGGGACVFDFNNDGWEDIYIAGGMVDDVLYLNKKKWQLRKCI